VKLREIKKKTKQSPKPGGYEKSFRDRTKGSGGIKYASHVDAFPVFFFLPPYLFILCACIAVGKGGVARGFRVEIFEEIKKKGEKMN